MILLIRLPLEAAWWVRGAAWMRRHYCEDVAGTILGAEWWCWMSLVARETFPCGLSQKHVRDGLPQAGCGCGLNGTPPRGQSATFIWDHAACVPSDLGLLPLTLYRCVFLGSSHSSRLPHVRFSLNSAAAVVGWQPASTVQGGGSAPSPSLGSEFSVCSTQSMGAHPYASYSMTLKTAGNSRVSDSTAGRPSSLFVGSALSTH